MKITYYVKDALLRETTEHGDIEQVTPWVMELNPTDKAKQEELHVGDCGVELTLPGKRQPRQFSVRCNCYGKISRKCGMASGTRFPGYLSECVWPYRTQYGLCAEFGTASTRECWRFPSTQRRIVRHIPQIFLRVTIKNQISIPHRVIVDQIIQLRPLVHILGDLILDSSAVNGDYATIGKFQLHAGGVDVELAGKQISHLRPPLSIIRKCSSAATIALL